jgi:acylphosphatase
LWPYLARLDRSPARFSRDSSGNSGINTGMDREQLRVLYTGRVQGVGFRYATKMLATGFDVTGVVRNLPDGRVELVLEGARRELEEFRTAMQDSEVGGLIRQEEAAWSAAKNAFRGFEIVR